jgi:hypothetical protein
MRANKVALLFFIPNTKPSLKLPVPPVLQTDSTTAVLFVTVEIAIRGFVHLKIKAVNVPVFLFFYVELAVDNLDLLRCFPYTARAVCEILKVNAMNIGLSDSPACQKRRNQQCE